MTDQDLKNFLANIAAENAAGFAALRASQEKTDAQLAKTDAQLAKTDAQLAKTDAQLAKTDAKLDRLATMYGGVSDNMGSAAQEYFFNSLDDSKAIGPLHFDQVLPKVFGGKMGAQQEYDLVLHNGDSAAIVEVKYKVHPSSLAQLTQQMGLFKQHFPEHAGMKLYGGVAGFHVSDEVTQQAHAQGFFVLKRCGDTFAMDATAMRAY